MKEVLGPPLRIEGSQVTPKLASTSDMPPATLAKQRHAEQRSMYAIQSRHRLPQPVQGKLKLRVDSISAATRPKPLSNLDPPAVDESVIELQMRYTHGSSVWNSFDALTHNRLSCRSRAAALLLTYSFRFFAYLVERQIEERSFDAEAFMREQCDEPWTPTLRPW